MVGSEARSGGRRVAIVAEMGSRPTAAGAPIAIALAAIAIGVAACGSDDPAETPAPEDDTTTTADAPLTSGPDSDEQAAFMDRYDGHTSPVYADGAYWHCRPDLQGDLCDGDMTATRLEADGSLVIEPYEPADDPPVDCFYVYPTVEYSEDSGNQTFDLPINPLEAAVVPGHAARFSEVCRVFAPRYEQATIGSYDAIPDGADMHDTKPFRVAYDGLLDAFAHYIANDNGGRDVVLIGHSQGSHHLVKLLQDEFERDPALRQRLLSALLIGPTGRVQVPAGELVGETFDSIPLCSSATERGCVVAYDSYAAGTSPDTDRPAEGLDTACVHPADLLGGSATLTGVYFTATAPGVTTPYEVVRDGYQATCTENPAGWSYLEVDVAQVPGDTRDLAQIDNAPSDSSLHVLDMNFGQGDLIALVRSQAAG